MRELFAEAGARPPTLLWEPTPADLEYAPLIDLLAFWQARAGRAAPLDTLLAELGGLAPNVMLVEALDDECDFHYRFYGRLIARHYGADLAGCRTLDIEGYVAVFAAAVYRAVTLRKAPIMTEHDPPRHVLVRHWRRLIVPLSEPSGRVVAMLVGSVPEDPIRDIVDAVADGVVVVDDRRLIRIVNPAAQRLFASEPDRLIGVRLEELLSWDKEVGEPHGAPPAPGRVVEASARRPDGSMVPIEVSVGGTTHHGRRLSVLVIRDITSRKAHERAIRRLVYRDALTGVANRRRFEERLGEALALAERTNGLVALVLLDLDKFKAVNDTHGHATGDLVLRLLARRLRPIIRASDLLARLGGDEFAILLTGLTLPAGATVFAARVLERLERPLHVGRLRLPLAASVGVAVWPEDGATAADLVGHADDALYAAKRAGGGRWLRYGAPSPQACD